MVVRKLYYRVAETREPYVIERRNGESLALISEAELNSLLETAHLLRSPRNASRLVTALERAQGGKLAPSSLEQLRPGAPASVVALVNQAMAKRPEDRFQTPAELVEAIDAILARDEEEVCLDLDEVARPGPDLQALYSQAQQAMAAGHWHKAVDLYSHILRSDPGYENAAQQLGAAGQQIRLGSL